MWQKELEKLECKSLVKGQIITDMPVARGVSDRVGDLAIEITDTEIVIKGILARIQLQRKKIIDYINTVDDSIMRQIMFLKNVSCMNWNEIANEVGGKNTEDSVRKAYVRYLIKENIV